MIDCRYPSRSIHRPNKVGLGITDGEKLTKAQKRDASDLSIKLRLRPSNKCQTGTYPPRSIHRRNTFGLGFKVAKK